MPVGVRTVWPCSTLTRRALAFATQPGSAVRCCDRAAFSGPCTGAVHRRSRPLAHASLQLTLGARYDRYDTFGSQISPRIAAAWVSGTSKIRAAYGAGFRAPAIGELYAPFFGNPGLDAEHSRNVEVGFDHFAGSATLSLTAFRSDYDNLISYDVVANRFGNISRARSHGI